MLKLVKGVLFLLVVGVIVLYAAGVFGPDRVEPGTVPGSAPLAAPTSQASATLGDVDVFEFAVGTVASRTRVGVAAQVTGRVRTVAARAGELVKAGQELVVLDDRELTARLQQAREGLEAAESNRERQLQAKVRAEALLVQAKARHERNITLRERGVATPEEMEAAQAGLLSAQAGVDDAVAAISGAASTIQQAEQFVAEATVALGHARVLAPIDGVIAERYVEPGDLALPGRDLLAVLDPNSLRLEAQVREGLIARIEPGQRLQVELPAAGKTVEAVVAELIPWADPASRTFLVRLNFDPVAGVYPGMFGRLRVPVGRRTVVSIPASTVARVGQLETVLVQEQGSWQRRLITTGELLADGGVEVLSGLRGDETVGREEER